MRLHLFCALLFSCRLPRWLFSILFTIRCSVLRYRCSTALRLRALRYRLRFKTHYCVMVVLRTLLIWRCCCSTIDFTTCHSRLFYVGVVVPGVDDVTVNRGRITTLYVICYFVVGKDSINLPILRYLHTTLFPITILILIAVLPVVMHSSFCSVVTIVCCCMLGDFGVLVLVWSGCITITTGALTWVLLLTHLVTLLLTLTLGAPFPITVICAMPFDWVGTWCVPF